MPTDQRSDEARAYRRLYCRKEWRARRAYQLARKPLCERCQKRGMLVPATDVNHIIPHKGDWMLFIAGDVESLCKSCHSGPVQSEEARGYSTELDATGAPRDPRHPWYSGGS